MRKWSGFKLASFLVALFIWQAPSVAQVGEPYQLSGDMVALGDVGVIQANPIGTSYRLSPDGRYAVYIADQRVDGVNEIFSVPITGGAAVRLNPNLVANGNVRLGSLSISADSTRVIYVADQRIDGVSELFSVPITGGAAINLNINLNATSGIGRLSSISPDSLRVIYTADATIDEQYELFSVPITGGQSIRLNSDLVAGGNVGSFLISPDSSRVIYNASQVVFGQRELFSVPITGGTPIRLIPSVVSGGNVTVYDISPDGSRVIYRADRRIDQVFELFSVPIAGGSNRRLSPDLVAGGDVQLNSFITIRISSNSQHVVFVADYTTDDVFELLSVPISGGPATRLSGPLAPLEDVFSFKITPDANRVVFLSDLFSNDVNQLWSVSIDGGIPLRINSSFTLSNGDVADFQISPDSQRVVYRADTITDNVFELFSAPTLGVASTSDVLQLTQNRGFNRTGLRDFEFSPDGERVIYRAAGRSNDLRELFSVPLLGGLSTRLNTNMPFGSDIDDFLITEDGNFVVYQGDQDVFDENELFAHRLKEEVIPDEELCIPIKAANGRVAVICL